MIDYFDLDFIIDTKKSTSGYVFMLAYRVISWRSRKQTLNVTSTMDVEFVSCFEVVSHGVLLKSFLSMNRVVESIVRSLKL